MNGAIPLPPSPACHFEVWYLIKHGDDLTVRSEVVTAVLLKIQVF
jgi:hypothetical protein